MKQLYILMCFWVIVGSWNTVHAQISGSVFRDFDLNGIRSDTLPIEIGVAGVDVFAFVDLNKVPIRKATDAKGNYSFSSSEIPAGKPVRIEFHNLPPGDYNGPYGSSSATSVQFIKAPSSHVNVGINYPADYCQRTNVRLIVPCYVNGNTQLTTDANGNPVANEKQAAKADALVSVAYEASGVASAANFPPEHIATADQIGSVWGLAYHRRTKKILSAAFIKRHMSLGPLGTGGIYMSDIVTHKTTRFLDVNTLGIDTGADPHTGLFADKTQASADPGAMRAVGRISIGGMDMSEDDKTLYFINLKDRKIYGVFINSTAVAPTSATAVKSWAIPDPGCSNGDFRPWALKVYHGKIYIGVVCSAETSQQKSDLSATIYRFDPNAATPVFETVLAFPLDFRRGPADLTTDPNQPDYDCTKYDHWLPWTDAWPTPCGLGDSRRFVMSPQPILSDLEFDDDGSMLIGFMDRFGNMSGVANHNPAGNGLYDGFTGGDLLRAYNNNGTLELEKNGKSGGLAGSGVGNGEGPVDENNVGGEFFGNDYWLFHNKVGHAEVSNGSLTFIPGYTEVITSAFDPITDIYQSGGFKVFGAKTGFVNRNYVLYTLEETPGVFGKAGGLGDVKALCDPASVEIGNRFWFDDNRDGIQDAYEPGIDGVVLTLHDIENGGTTVGTQTTHDGGQFYFNNATVPGGLRYMHKYEIRMDTAQLRSLDITLDGVKPLAASGGRLAARAVGARQGAASRQRYYALSPANQANYADADLRDSDALLVGQSAVISVTTMDAGQNDFTNDLSIYSCPELTTEKDTVSLCPGVKLDSIAAVGNYLSRVDSVRFVLFTSPQSGTAMYANTGVVLGTVKPGPNINRAVLYNPLITTDNNTGNKRNQYIYAIIYPTPANVSCRQSDKTVIKIAPSLRAVATGGTLTCSVKSLTLKGQAQYSDGTPAPSAVYRWRGPSSFSSVVQNPTVSVAGSYTLTVGDPACSASFTTTITSVTSDTMTPNLNTSVVGKSCPSCAARISATAPGASLRWSGPGSFTAVGSEVDVVVDGLYSVTATGSNGCWSTAQVLVSPSYCPVVELSNSSLSLCSGMKLDSISVQTDHLQNGESIRFVVFSTPQSGTAMYGSGGVVLGTVLPVGKRAVLVQPQLNTFNTGSVVLKQYVYALIYPTPGPAECRQSDELVVSVSPSVKAVATGGTLTCSVKSLTLKGQAQYGDGTPAPSAVYRWRGPSSFSSVVQNPTVSVAGSYTLTVGDPACPASFTTATISVTSDTIAPVLQTSVSAKLCVSCAATISAQSLGATLSWTGPNGFLATGSSQTVTADGLYTITATGVNGCTSQSTVNITPYACPPVVCLPFGIRRIR
ncbi:SdrD B-like domain-containing protein [Spirosoma linguale]|uniref:SD-repeat containing protein B domain-containing protein n=1 Tax=Spirosoma linguale (strain ATCC 33905 / DSM 74 / LMG 10896 / Claus 1) TaxID=504472 RepID=D2QJK2_SPILD|nr:hypothetical protein Slin_4061 [Spirosoma linguale DSM 74]